VVVNAALAAGELDLLSYFLDNRQVRHALIFDGQRAQLPTIPANLQPKVQVSHAALPDLRCIQTLLAIIDPSSQERNQRYAG
jgi:hypothetical protein